MGKHFSTMIKLIICFSFLISARAVPATYLNLIPSEYRTINFLPGSGDQTYNWGYLISPSRGHIEQKDREGIVTGIVSFENAHGNVVQWQYSAHPQNGFKVTEYKEISLKEANTEFNRNTPLLKDAQGLGYIKPESYDQNKVRYQIDNEVVRAAGSESQLAYNLNAIPVAAVHDVQVPPAQRRTSDQTSPVLIAKDPSHEYENSNYFLEVPIL